MEVGPGDEVKKKSRDTKKISRKQRKDNSETQRRSWASHQLRAEEKTKEKTCNLKNFTKNSQFLNYTNCDKCWRKKENEKLKTQRKAAKTKKVFILIPKQRKFD